MSNEKYLQELSRFQGSISVLLENIHRLIMDLPDRKDKKITIKEIENVRIEIEKINNFLSESMLVEKAALTEITNSLKILEKKIDDFSNDCTLEPSDELATIILGEMDRLKKKMEKDIIKIEDFKEVIDYAKRKNKAYEFWKGWKSKVLIAFGIISGFAAFAHKIIDGVIKLIDIFQKRGWF